MLRNLHISCIYACKWKEEVCTDAISPFSCWLTELARINFPFLKGENRPFVYICTEMCIWDVVALCWMWTCLVNGNIEKYYVYLYICINLYIHVCICVCIDKAIYIYFPNNVCVIDLQPLLSKIMHLWGILDYSASLWESGQSGVHHQPHWNSLVTGDRWHWPHQLHCPQTARWSLCTDHSHRAELSVVGCWRWTSESGLDRACAEPHHPSLPLSDLVLLPWLLLLHSSTTDGPP